MASGSARRVRRRCLISFATVSASLSAMLFQTAVVAQTVALGMYHRTGSATHVPVGQLSKETGHDGSSHQARALENIPNQVPRGRSTLAWAPPPLASPISNSRDGMEVSGARRCSCVCSRIRRGAANTQNDVYGRPWCDGPHWRREN